MGFNVTALAQKARTQTLIVDSDLNMGQYDVLATDVKGDTAEFAEFVGGVGNFESGIISGGLDVGDILHAESSMQIDGDLVVEGAINNVNITNEGAISTAKSITATGGFKGNVTGSISGGTVAGSTGTFSGAVTGATGTFNGAVTGSTINGASITSTKVNNVLVKQGVITVTPSNTVKCTLPYGRDGSYGGIGGCNVLPIAPNTKYTGSIRIYNSNSASLTVSYQTDQNARIQEASVPGSGYYNISFTGISFLNAASYSTVVSLCEFTLT